VSLPSYVMAFQLIAYRPPPMIGLSLPGESVFV
jgi:hypothetical protein